MQEETKTYKTLEELVRVLNATYVYFRYTTHQRILDMGLRYWNGDALCPKGMPIIKGDMVTLEANGIGNTGTQTRTINAKEVHFVTVVIATQVMPYYYKFDPAASEWKVFDSFL